MFLQELDTEVRSTILQITFNRIRDTSRYITNLLCLLYTH